MNCAVHSNVEASGYCRNCGKPMCPECTRNVGGALYCEPCLAAKVATVPPAAPDSRCCLPATFASPHRLRG